MSYGGIRMQRKVLKQTERLGLVLKHQRDRIRSEKAVKLRLRGGYKGFGKEHEVCGTNVRCNLRNKMEETENTRLH
jgi:hypothetical protein